MKMMKFISLLLFASTALADSQVAICEKEALHFGDGSGKDHIPDECKTHFESLATPKLKKKSRDGSVTVTAYRNIIFIKDPKSKMKGQNVIAGKYTQLENIKEVILDEANSEIVVVESSGDILFFSSVITGNVSPKRILRHAALESVDSIEIHKDEVIAFDSKNSELMVYSRKANVHALEGMRHLSPLKTITNVKGDQLVIDKTKGELSVVHSGLKTRKVFDLEKKSFIRSEKIEERKPASTQASGSDT